MAQDKELSCKDCGQNFTFTEGEQEFFTQRGFSEPVRCRPCRDARKAQKVSGGGFSDRGQRDRY
ncbi:MAG: zinc-ribbon domain-containing protein [Armatimonadota bacterium]|nr:zinc-ribbon domain-containing protein [Armatimonadota bacterium]